MIFPSDENGDVLRRMEQHGFDFATEWPVDFYALFTTPEGAKAVLQQYAADHKAGDRVNDLRLSRLESGEIELLVIKQMYVTHSNVTAFETEFGRRVATWGGRLDGWGVMQE